MIPERRRWLVVHVPVILFFESGAGLLKVPCKPGLHLAIALRLDIAAVEMGDRPDTCRIVRNAVTVDGRILRKEMAVRQVVLPPDVDRLPLLGLDCRSGVLTPVSPDSRRRKITVERLLDLSHLDLVVRLTVFSAGRLHGARSRNLVNPPREFGRTVSLRIGLSPCGGLVLRGLGLGPVQQTSREA